MSLFEDILKERIVFSGLKQMYLFPLVTYTILVISMITAKNETPW